MTKVKSILCASVLALSSMGAFANGHTSGHLHSGANLEDARVSGSMGAISWGVGLRFGEGHVKVGDHEHKFRVSGLSVLSAGLAGGNFKGKIHNLKQLSDLDGKFTFAETGVAYGLGANVHRWVNDKGVILELHGVSVGVEARIGPGVMYLTMVN